MVSINEELEAAKAARAVIKVLSGVTPKSAVLAPLSRAEHAAVLNLGSGGNLDAARANVGVAISSVIHSLPTSETIDKAKSAIDAWIKELEASTAE